jgi:hypothetical protein
MQSRESKMRRNIHALNAAIAAIGIAGMAGWTYGQTVSTVTGAMTNGVDIEGTGPYDSASDAYYAIDGAADTYPSYVLQDFSLASAIPAGQTVTSVAPNFTVDLYNDEYTYSTDTNTTMFFYMTTDTTTNDVYGVGTSPLVYNAAGSLYGEQVNGGRGIVPTQYAAGSTFFFLGTGTYNATTLTNNQVLSYNLTLSSAAAEQYVVNDLNQTGGNTGDIRIAISSDETDSNYISLDGPAPYEGAAYVGSVSFTVTTTASASNTSTLYFAGSADPNLSVTSPGTKNLTASVGTLVTIAPGQTEYAVLGGNATSAVVTLGNSSTNTSDTLSYRPVNGSLGVASSANPVIYSASTGQATVGFSASNTNLAGGSTLSGNVQFANASNSNDAPVSINLNTNVIESRFMNTTLLQAPVNVRGLVGSIASASEVLVTANTDVSDYTPDSLSTIYLTGTGSPYSVNTGFSLTTVQNSSGKNIPGTLGIVMAAFPGTQVVDNQTTTQYGAFQDPFTGNDVTANALAEVQIVTSGLGGGQGGSNFVLTLNGAGKTASFTPQYSQYKAPTLGAAGINTSEGLPGGLADVFVQWEGYQTAAVTATNSSAGTSALASGNTLTLTDLASNDFIATFTTVAAGVTSTYTQSFGLRAGAYVTGVTMPDGWSQSGLTAASVNPTTGTLISGTEVYGSGGSSGSTSSSDGSANLPYGAGDTNSYTASTPVTFAATPAMINGMYAGNTVVGLENEQDIQGAAPNDLPSATYAMAPQNITQVSGTGGGTYALYSATLTTNVPILSGSLTEYGGQALFTGGGVNVPLIGLTGSFTENGGYALFPALNSTGTVTLNGGTTAIFPNGTGPGHGNYSPSTPEFSVGGLNVTGGTLDIENNMVQTGYAGYANEAAADAGIFSALAAGFSHGWDGGPGIISSTVATENSVQSALIYSVGYADGSDGITSVPSGVIEIMPTLAGDAKLTGTVVFGDFQLLSQYFGAANTTWDEGDFTYNGTTNFGDFQLLSQNFGQSASGLTAGEVAGINSFAAQFGDAYVSNGSGGFALVSVPEPASAGLLALAGLGILRRRKRKN